MLVSCQPEWLCNIILQSNNPSTLSRPERKREFLSADITCKDTDTWKNPWTCTRITHINSLRTHPRPEAVIWRSNVPFHLEISGCNHDVRNGRQSDRRSRTHLQADIKQRHVCVCTDRWTLMMKTCWVCFTCSLPRSILSIRLSPLWRSSSRFISSWAILSYKVKQLHLYEECVLPSLLSVNLHTKLCEIKIFL